MLRRAFGRESKSSSKLCNKDGTMPTSTKKYSMESLMTPSTKRSGRLSTARSARKTQCRIKRPSREQKDLLLTSANILLIQPQLVLTRCRPQHGTIHLYQAENKTAASRSPVPAILPPPPPPPSSAPARKDPFYCFKCGQEGHTAKACPENKQK